MFLFAGALAMGMAHGQAAANHQEKHSLADGYERLPELPLKNADCT